MVLIQYDMLVVYCRRFAPTLFPQRENNPAAQPPLAPPMGELASEARLRGRLQWQICTLVP